MVEVPTASGDAIESVLACFRELIVDQFQSDMYTSLVSLGSSMISANVHVNDVTKYIESRRQYLSQVLKAQSDIFKRAEDVKQGLAIRSNIKLLQTIHLRAVERLREYDMISIPLMTAYLTELQDIWRSFEEVLETRLEAPEGSPLRLAIIDVGKTYLSDWISFLHLIKMLDEETPAELSTADQEDVSQKLAETAVDLHDRTSKALLNVMEIASKDKPYFLNDLLDQLKVKEAAPLTQKKKNKSKKK